MAVAGRRLFTFARIVGHVAIVNVIIVDGVAVILTTFTSGAVCVKCNFITIW